MAIGYKQAIIILGDAKEIRTQDKKVAAVPIRISGQPKVEPRFAKKQPMVTPLMKSGRKKQSKQSNSAKRICIGP